MKTPIVTNRRNRTSSTPPPGTVYVGRPSKWGNPFYVRNECGGRDKAVRDYASWIRKQPHLMSSLHELRGKNLECWCAPEKCHADVLLKLANK